MKILSVLSCLIFFISCVGQKVNQNIKVDKLSSVVNSKWVTGFSEFLECYSIYFKSDGKYEDFNCEVQYTFSGTYEVKNDTIYLTEIDLVSDLPGTTETEIKSISKMVLTEKGLTTVYQKSKTVIGWDEEWINSPTIFFKKSK